VDSDRAHLLSASPPNLPEQNVGVVVDAKGPAASLLDDLAELGILVAGRASTTT
jgi:hypothetical protein